MYDPSKDSNAQDPFAKLEGIVLPILKREDAASRRLWKEIDRLALGAFKGLGLNFIRRHLYWRILRALMTLRARRGLSLSEIEGQLRFLFQRRRGKLHYPAADRRALRSYEQIKDYLVGDTLLDLGAGNGLISQHIRDKSGMSVTLTDVVDYSLVLEPIQVFQQGERLPFDKEFADTILVYLVLHHADDPLQLLSEAVRVTKSRLIIMEGYVDEPDDYLVNCFFDWFLNRVMQGVDINVPLNYQRVEDWKKNFEELGLEIHDMDIVGIDEPVAPEHHVLFVLNK